MDRDGRGRVEPFQGRSIRSVYHSNPAFRTTRFSESSRTIRGNLWMSSNKGVFRVSRKQLNDFAEKKIGAITTISYGASDGMPTPECNGGFQPAGWKSHDGRLWFPTMKGVVVVDPKKVGTGGPAPAAVLEQAFVDHRSVPGKAGCSSASRKRRNGVSLLGPEFSVATKDDFSI